MQLTKILKWTLRIVGSYCLVAGTMAAMMFADIVLIFVCLLFATTLGSTLIITSGQIK